MFQLSKKKILIALLIWAICIIITVVVTLNINKQDDNKDVVGENNSNIVSEKKDSRKDVSGVDFYGTYNENDLVIEKKQINDEVYYYQISGLKNEEIQNKINQEIYDKAVNISTGGQYYSSSVSANFGDVLSIYFIINYPTPDENGLGSKTEYLNYDLNTGNQLTLEELFTNDTNIESVLNSAFYETLSYQILRGDSPDKDNQIAELEDRIFAIILGIKKGNYKFGFSNTGITVTYNDITTTIDVQKYAENLAYFTRFKNEKSIYTNDNVGRDNLLVANIFTDLAYYDFEYIGDYGFIDYAFLSTINQDSFDKIIDAIGFNKDIKNSRQKMDKNKFTYINAEGQVYKDDKYDMYSVYYSTQVCTMNKEYFNTKIKEIIYRQKTVFGGAFTNVTHFGDDKSINCEYLTENVGPYGGMITNKSLFVNKNFKIIEDVSDVFKDGVDYDSILNEKIDEYLDQKYPDFPEYKNGFKANMTYNFDYSGITIRSSFSVNDSFTISYDEFDRSILTI